MNMQFKLTSNACVWFEDSTGAPLDSVQLFVSVQEPWPDEVCKELRACLGDYAELGLARLERLAAIAALEEQMQ